MTFLAGLRTAWRTLSENFSGNGAGEYRQLSKLDERLLDDIGISRRRAEERDEKKIQKSRGEPKDETNT
ncbi:hypothetical protein B5P46_01450 [Rhizobium leguminosarum]|uniref:YjiS-like domain-containing protein n=1 Tax=Rhizobium leguminosarum TaxID=384 RepID=A0A4Q1UCR5_RHILE|nr:hypothetical protein B5P46_01450 [Rhizobium leguminosarum]